MIENPLINCMPSIMHVVQEFVSAEVMILDGLVV